MNSCSRHPHLYPLIACRKFTRNIFFSYNFNDTELKKNLPTHDFKSPSESVTFASISHPINLSTKWRGCWFKRSGYQSLRSQFVQGQMTCGQPRPLFINPSANFFLTPPSSDQIFTERENIAGLRRRGKRGIILWEIGYDNFLKVLNNSEAKFLELKARWKKLFEPWLVQEKVIG